jgi:hypothetical protein
VSLDKVLWFSASVTEAAVIGLLLYRRVWRNFPIFVAYSIWTLAASVGVYAISRNLSSSVYLTTYLAEIIIDSILLFSVLVELAWSLLRPIRTSLSRGVLVPIAAIILTVGAAVWPFTIVPGARGLSWELITLLRLQQTVSILQIFIFLAFVASTQLLSIGWRDRELQIATGLGFTSLVGLAVTVLHAQPAFRLQYNHLNQLGVGAYLCSLLYWLVSFAQQEEQRREFTPQMQSMLLAVAGAARATRVGLADSSAGTERKKSDW